MAMSLEYITNRMAEKKKAGLPMAMNQPTEDDSEVSYDEYKRRALEMGAKESGLATFDQYEEVRGRIGGALKKYKGGKKAAPATAPAATPDYATAGGAWSADADSVLRKIKSR
jgi:hypothetical protein